MAEPTFRCGSEGASDRVKCTGDKIKGDERTLGLGLLRAQ